MVPAAFALFRFIISVRHCMFMLANIKFVCRGGTKASVEEQSKKYDKLRVIYLCTYSELIT